MTEESTCNEGRFDFASQELRCITAAHSGQVKRKPSPTFSTRRRYESNKSSTDSGVLFAHSSGLLRPESIYWNLEIERREVEVRSRGDEEHDGHLRSRRRQHKSHSRWSRQRGQPSEQRLDRQIRREGLSGYGRLRGQHAVIPQNRHAHAGVYRKERRENYRCWSYRTVSRRQ